MIGEWLPDLPDLNNPGVTVARNVLPAQASYLPWPAMQAYSTAIDARCRGAVYARDKDGNVYVYAGDAAKLYGLSGTSFSDYSKGGGYALAATENWEFAKWGEDILAAGGVNGAATNNIQTLTMGGSTFADLSGSPPQARHIAVVRDFVVVGNTHDSTDGNVPNRVRWSGINDNTAWSISATTQADKEDLPTGGWVQRVVGGEYGVVFQEFSIRRMSYVGSPVVWQFDEVLPGRGTPCPGSVAQFGDMIFYLSQDGFEVLINGTRSEAIGAQKIDREFWSSFESSYTDRVTATIDPVNQRVYWAYPESGNADGEPNRMLCFDWSVRRWTDSAQSTQKLFIAATSGATLDNMDASIAATASEIATNGAFATDSDWTKGTGWTIGSGTATHAAGTASELSQDITASQGTGYYVTFTVSGRTAGSVTVDVGGTSGTARSTNATFTETVHGGSADTEIAFSATSDFDGSIDDVSVKNVSMDSISEPLDSRTWQGGSAQVGAFDTDNKLAFNTGSALAGVVETGEQGGNDRTRLRAVRALVDGGATTVQVGTRDKQADSVEWTGTASPNSNGLVTRRSNARYHRFRLNVSGSYEVAGVEGVASNGGTR